MEFSLNTSIPYTFRIRDIVSSKIIFNLGRIEYLIPFAFSSRSVFNLSNFASYSSSTTSVIFAFSKITPYNYPNS